MKTLILSSYFHTPLFPRGGGGKSHMKVVGMLVVSFSGVNFGFWSHLRCSGQNTMKKNIYISSVVSFRGQKKVWATPRSVSFRGLIQNFRRAPTPLSYAESPPLTPPPPLTPTSSFHFWTLNLPGLYKLWCFVYPHP